IDEFLAIKGRGPDATFADPGIPRIVPILVDVLRAQRSAKCNGSAECLSLRQQLAKDVEQALASKVFGASLDVLDVVLKDQDARREIGMMTSYMTRQNGDGGALGGSTAPSSPSSTPFVSGRGPGALDQSVAAAVDALGALGDLHDIRPLYPI